jgi:TonB family protein
MLKIICLSVFLSLSVNRMVSAQIQGTSVLKDSVYTKVDKMPEFPGGMKALMKIVDGNHHYPKEARKNKIQGKVFLEFVIYEDGTPGDFKVTQGLGFGCDDAALDLLKPCQNGYPES